MFSWVKPVWDAVKRAVNVPSKQDIDAVEGRIQNTIQANHQMVVSELKDHDKRARDWNVESREWLERRNVENREWLQKQQENHREWAEKQFYRQEEKLDNFLTIVGKGRQ